MLGTAEWPPRYMGAMPQASRWARLLVGAGTSRVLIPAERGRVVILPGAGIILLGGAPAQAFSLRQDGRNQEEWPCTARSCYPLGSRGL